jgi:hypothetical protein
VHTATHYRAHCHTLLLALPHTATHCCTLPHCQTVYFIFILVCLYNTHQVLVGLPQGIDGLATLFVFISFYFISDYFHNTHQALIGLPQGVGGLAILSCMFCF